jgi:hypothetical protein
MRGDQGHELLDCHEKRNHVNETKQPQNNKTRQPIIVSAGEKLSEELLICHHQA